MIAKASRLLDQLVLDYVTIRSTYPSPPASQGRTAPRGSREYGHPAQWASDTCREIANCLDETDEALRDHLNHLPPPPRIRSEARVVNHAYNSMKARLEYLNEFPGLDAFLEEARDIHNRIRHTLGLSRQRVILPFPCPNCSNLGVLRTVYDDRRDIIECPSCGCEIKESEYGLYARMLVDELIEQADALHATNITS